MFVAGSAGPTSTWTSGLAHVQQTAQRITSAGWVFRQPKTRLSRRAIALWPATVLLLRRHRREQLEARLLAGSAYQDKDLVFASGSALRSSPGPSTGPGRAF